MGDAFLQVGRSLQLTKGEQNKVHVKSFPKTTSRGSSIKDVRKIFLKTNTSNPSDTHTYCAYQGVRNVSFSENFACVLNGWLLRIILKCRKE